MIPEVMHFVVKGWESSLITYHWSGLRRMDGEADAEEDDDAADAEDDEEGVCGVFFDASLWKAIARFRTNAL